LALDFVRSVMGQWERKPLAWHAGSVVALICTLEGPAGTRSSYHERGSHVSKSVLEAIREGDWFFEPEEVDAGRFHATAAIPGSPQKLEVLAARARAGLPLWHEGDRNSYEHPDLE
jgi:hypothetical protein